jgi:hypothetical protein
MILNLFLHVHSYLFAEFPYNEKQSVGRSNILRQRVLNLMAPEFYI